MSIMIPRRLNINNLIWYPIRRYSSKLPTDEPPIDQNETKEEKVLENKPKTSEASDKIKRLLQGMIEDKTKLEAQHKQFESKIPYNDIGFRGRPKKLKPEEEELHVMKTAAKKIVENLEDESKIAESEILSKALDGPKRIDLDWKEFIAGMAVDNTVETDSFTRAKVVKDHLQSRGALSRKPRGDQRDSFAGGDNLFGGEPLDIFTKTSQSATKRGPVLKTWEYLQNKDLELAVAQPPSNYFEKMILWTNQGKIWKFPIDNEQGLEDENKVHFSEHIFLETHLEGWCPDKGPIRHFMELVCVGLSKNPYCSVEYKKEHIMWFKEYFESKKDILISHGIWHNQEKSAEKMEA